MIDSTDTLTSSVELSSSLQLNSVAEEIVVGEPRPTALSLAGKKFYTVPQILFITLFGTLLAGIYGLAANYRQIDDRKSFRLTLLMAVVATPAYIGAYVLLPKTSYDLLFPLFPGALMGLVAALLQSHFVGAALRQGAVRRSIFDQLKLVGVSLSCVFFLSILIFFVSDF